MKQPVLSTVPPSKAIVPALLLIVALTLGVTACAPASKPADISPASFPTAGQATSELQVSAPSTAAASSSPRDLSSMNACTLIPGEAVAKALNATLSDPGNPGTGSGGPDCTYGLIPNGATVGTQLYNIFILSPDLYDISQNAFVDGQPIAGLGDKAVMGTRAGTTSYDLIALKTGEFAIEVIGNDPGLVQELAHYALNNL
jgi:hypothetical protein